MMENLSGLPVVACRPKTVVDAFNLGFFGYLVSMEMTVETFERRFRAEDLDPFASRVWLYDGAPAGILLITRRGRVSRIGAVGVSPVFRGLGIGRLICEYAIEDARLRADTHIWLEVLESNVPALNLYRNIGFREHSRLLGFRCQHVEPGGTPGQAREVTIDEGIHAGCRKQITRDLPWLLQIPTLAASTLPVRCFLDPAEENVVMVDEGPYDMRVTGLLSSGDGTGVRDFMAALGAHFPGRAWIASPIFPEQYAERFFRPAGWLEADTRQIRMVCPLDEPGT